MSVQAWNPSVIIDHVDSNGNIIANNGYGAFDTDNYLYDYKNPGNLSPGWEENGESIRYGRNSVGGIAIGRYTDIVSETARAGTYQSGIALGDYARAKGSFAVGIGAYSQATDIAAMAIGAAAKATGFNSLAMMRQSAALGTYSTAIGTASWADAESSFALGYSSTALGKQSIAIGAAAKEVSWDDKGTQIGSYVSDGHTEAAADRSFALGTEAKTSVDATDSLAIGTGARTTAANTLAVGTLSKAQDSDALAFGSNATSSGKNALSMGTSSEASGDNSFAIGNTANAEGDGSLALGTKSNAAGEDSFALGRATTAKAERAIAIGSEASASKERTIAIGDTSSVTGDASIAIGVGANVGANNSIALGTNTRVNGPLVNGWSAFTNEMNNNEENGVIAVGNVGMERRIINVAGGEKDTDAVNVKQLRYVNSNLARSIGGDSYTGYEDNGSTYLAPDFSVKGTTYHTVKEAVEAAQTNYYSVNTQVDGDTTGAGSNYSNDGATGSGALAAGLWASATGADSVAVGRKATANGGGDVAIGYQAGRNATNGSDAVDGYTHNVFIGNDAGTDTESYRNVAIGAGAQTEGSKGKEGYMVALGSGAVATDEGSISIGGMATSQKNAIAVGQSAVAGKSSIAIGYGSQTTAEKTVLLGNLITGSTQANSVVLGNASTDRVATTEHSSTIEGITYGEFAGAGSIKKGVVSVGAPTNERQIINVAAGRIAADSTDAINGSQLYATNTAIGHVANSVVTVMGGEARLGSDGTITTSNIGGTGKDTVHDAIQANKTRIDTNEINISTNAGNIATNSQHITENAGNIATNTQHITDNSRRISENATTISNVNQKVEAGWEIQYDGTKLKDVTPSSRVVNLKAGTNMVLAGEGDAITISTSKEPTFDVVRVGGNTTISGDGVTISGGPSVTKNGIDAGNKKITNVADGTNNSDAVNKGQLDKVAAAANTKVEGSDNIAVDESVDNETKAKTYTVKLKDNIILGTEPEKQISLDGTNGKATVGKVAVDGSNGHVTGLTNTEWDVDNPQAVSGRAATEDQLKKATSGLTTKGINVSGNSGTQAHFNLGETIPIKGEGAKNDSAYSGENIKTIVKDGTLFVMMDKDINATTVTVGKDGVDGKDGQPGSITIIGQPGKDGANGEPGKNAKADITVIEGKPGVDGKDGLNGKDGITRIQYTDRDNNTHEVATLDDGMKYGGDAGTVIKKKLNEQVNVIGGITDSDAFTEEDNLGVVSDGENNLKVRLAKELKGLTKVTVVDGTNKTEVTPGTIVTTDSNGSTTVNGEGLTTGDTKVTTNGVTNGDTSLTKDGLTISGGPSVTKNGIDAGNQKVTNVADGTKDSDAVNKGQLDKVAAAANTKVEGSDNIAVDESVDNETKAKTYTVKLKDSITLGSEPEKQISLDGTTGTVSIGAGDKAIVIDAVGSTITAGRVAVDGANGYVTGLTNTEWDVDNPQAVSGRAATEDQLKKATSGLTTKGINVSGNSGTQAHFNLGETIPIKGEGAKNDSAYSGENIKTIVKDGTLFVMMDKDINATTVTVGKDGVDGKDGQPGSITIIGQPGKDGANGEPGKNAKADITVIEGKPGVDGKDGLNGKDGITRIQYTDRDNNTHEVATLDDGMKYGGDAGTVIKKKLNEQVNVVGGITDTNAFTAEDNLGVVSDGENNLKVRLAKELKGLTKVTVVDGTNKTEVTPGTIVTTDSNGSTTVNGEGLAINDGPSVTKNGIDAGNQKITNVADGTNNSDAVNKGQLDKVAAAANTKVEGSDNIAVDESVDNETKAKTYTVKLKDSITLGSEPEKQISLDGTNGKATVGKVVVDGANGHVTGLTNTEWDVDNPQAVSGRAATEDQLKKATSSLTTKGINVSGNSGTQAHFNLGETIPIKGEGTKDDSSYSGENIKTIVTTDGTLLVTMDKDITTDSVTAKTVTVGKDGIDGKNGQPGSITIIGQPGKDGANGEPGKNAKADITVIEGKPGVDGTNGLNGKDGITRIQYIDRDNNTHEVATLDDGMKYGGDAGTVIKKKLNEQVNVVGGITDTNAFTAEDNLGVVSDGKDNLKVRLAKELKGLTKVTVVDGANKTEITPGTIVTTDSNGSTTVNGEGLTINDGPSVTKNGIDAGGDKITNVAKGENPTDAVNKSQLDDVAKAAMAANTKVEGSDNIDVDESVDNETKAKTYTVKLKDNITLGTEPEKQISLDGTTGTVSIGAGDKAIVIDAVGSTITAGRVAVDGTNGHVTGLTNTEWDVDNLRQRS